MNRARSWLAALLAPPARKYQLGVLLAMLFLVVAGKHFYSGASAAELHWLLAPTAKLVGLGTGSAFVYEAGTGWVSRSEWFIIAPGCAGMNFLLAAFAALVAGSLVSVRGAATAVKSLAVAIGLAFAATIVINTARILIAIELHHDRTTFGSLSPADIHQLEGILVYLGGLCGLYALARLITKGSRHEAPAA